MSAMKELKRKCLHDIVQMRTILRQMDDYIHSGDVYHLHMVSTFFDTLRHHLNDGDLRPENIDLILNLKLKENK